MPEDFDQYPPETLLELGKLSLRLSRHKDTRRDFLKTIKKVAPDYTLPGDQQVEDLRQEIAEQNAARETAERQAAITARLERQKASLREGTLVPGVKFDDDAIKEIEETVMPKYGIADYEAAAKIYASDRKPTPPKPGDRSTGTWTFPDIPGLQDDPAGAARNAAFATIDELRGR